MVNEKDGEKEVGSGSGLKAPAVVIDAMSPYYLHASDKPGDVFVGSLLKDGNYGDWLDDMSNSLYAKNKIGFVNGEIPQPDADDPYLPYWMRSNAMVKGWLLSSMEPEVRRSVKFRTAREIWADLEERFGKESAPRAYELRRALGLVRQNDDSVSSYYGKLREIWDEANSISPIPTCSCGGCKCGGCKCNMVKLLNEWIDRDRLYD